MFEFIGKLIGDVVGSVIGMSAAAVATILELPVAAVSQAMKSGCKTYEEIREFVKDEF